MAGRSSSSLSMVASQHRLFAPARPTHGADQGVELDLDEADVIWGAGTGTTTGGGPYSSSPSSSSPFLPSAGDPYGRSPPVAAPSKTTKPRGGGGGQGPASVPVNIPDWSKILGSEYAGGARRGWAHDYDAAEDGGAGAAYGSVSGSGTGRRWVPPHEVLQCRERAAACSSVREGAGRTLKGRDLRRVRNAIWEKTGFQD